MLCWTSPAAGETFRGPNSRRSVQAMRKSEQESETAEQYEVRWRLDKDADKAEHRGEVDSGVRSADGDGTVGLISTGEQRCSMDAPGVSQVMRESVGGM